MYDSLRSHSQTQRRQSRQNVIEKKYMKKIFIHRTAVMQEEAIAQGFGRNLYFITHSLGYSVIFMNKPNEMVKALLHSESINYQNIDRDTPQDENDVLVSANDFVAFPGLALAYNNESGWDIIYSELRKAQRQGEVKRTTKETDIFIKLALEGHGKTEIDTGLGFFDHMLDQIGKHSGCDLTIKVKGDLNVDEHHTIEDTAIALGEAFNQAIGDKKGLSRYGFFLPMDDSICWTAIDFGGRPWINWVVDFKRDYVGDMPTEMFMHFFKSFSDAARCNLYIKAEGDNEHHKIEGIFKAFARSIKMAIKQEPYNMDIPTTKGLL